MKLYRLLIAACSIALASCQTAPPKLQIPGSFPSPAASVKRVPSGPASASSVMSALQVSATPSVSVPVEAVSAVASNAAAPALPGPPISVSIENMPIPKFINEIYGELLHVNFQMDPALDKLTDLVTLRIPKAVPRIEFYRMATAVLRTYGLSARWDGQFVRIQPVRASEGSEPPLIISGRALPSVPESHRPIFQMVDLKYVRASDAANWLRTAYKMEGLSIDTDVNRNSIILFGKPAVVLQAAQAIAVLDRPYLRGHFSARLTPVFISATELAAHLTQILNAEGYAASNIIAPNSSVLVLPIQAVNSVIVFAPSESILEHVEQWAKSIDKPAASPNGQNFFYYQVRNTRAAEIASVLQGASGAGGSPVSAPQAAPPGQAARQPAATGGAALSGGGNLLVDQPRNALIFRGSADEWARLEPLIREMDRPARQVMVEVTIAEAEKSGRRVGCPEKPKDDSHRESKHAAVVAAELPIEGDVSMGRLGRPSDQIVTPANAALVRLDLQQRGHHVAYVDQRHGSVGHVENQLAADRDGHITQGVAHGGSVNQPWTYDRQADRGMAEELLCSQIC